MPICPMVPSLASWLISVCSQASRPNYSWAHPTLPKYSSNNYFPGLQNCSEKDLTLWFSPLAVKLLGHQCWYHPSRLMWSPTQDEWSGQQLGHSMLKFSKKPQWECWMTKLGLLPTQWVAISSVPIAHPNNRTPHSHLPIFTFYFLPPLPSWQTSH